MASLSHNDRSNLSVVELKFINPQGIPEDTGHLVPQGQGVFRQLEGREYNMYHKISTYFVMLCFVMATLRVW